MFKPYNSFDTQFYQKVKAICKKRRIHITRLEELIGVSRGYFNCNKAANSSPSLRVVLNICNALEVSVDELLNYKGVTE